MSVLDQVFPVCMAPMVGLSHLAFRRLVRSYLPEGAEGLWPTEMLNSRRLPYENLLTTPQTYRDQEERFLAPQILGNEEKYIELTVKKLTQEWGAQAIDINMGCPVKKALRHNYGVALMGDPDYAAQVAAMTVKHSSVPVSVKLRSGYGRDRPALLEFVRGLESSGVAWLTLHPRTAAEKRRGQANWQELSWLREHISIPLIGNGDVQTVDDVFRMKEITGVKTIMVGRALTARPWLVWQVGERLGLPPPLFKEGSAPDSPEEEGAEYGRALLYFIEQVRDLYTESLGLRLIRFFVRTGAVWLDFGNRLNGELAKANCTSEAAERVHSFFQQPIRLCQRTELRQ